MPGDANEYAPGSGQFCGTTVEGFLFNTDAAPFDYVQGGAGALPLLWAQAESGQRCPEELACIDESEVDRLTTISEDVHGERDGSETLPTAAVAVSLSSRLVVCLAAIVVVLACLLTQRWITWTSWISVLGVMCLLY